MEEDEITHWLELPAGMGFVPFSELARLIARAQHPIAEADEYDADYHCARMNLEEELPKAVAAKRLTVRNASGHGVHTFPHGFTLQSAVVKVSDLREFLADRGMGVHVVGSGGDPTRSNVDNAAASAEPAPLLALVAADASTPAENADAPVAAAVPSIASLGKATTPPPLTTPEIADAFDGVDGKTAKQWRGKLGDVNNHQWLIEARAQKAPAPRPATWWPIAFAELLLARGASDESLYRAFVAAPKLKPWLALWQEKRRDRNAFGQ